MDVDVEQINVYHMVHVDRLRSIIDRGALFADLTLKDMGIEIGTSIAYENIRERRRDQIVFGVPDLVIGGCVPFYFGTHTPMLYRAKMGKIEGYEYDGGQDPILYLVFRMVDLIREAQAANLHWFFTDGNAAARLTNHYFNLAELNRLNWDVLHSSQWAGHRDEKQAEFLVEKQVKLDRSFLGIGVRTEQMKTKVVTIVKDAGAAYPVVLKKDWYFEEESHG